jgi:hypothetical protein
MNQIYRLLSSKTFALYIFGAFRWNVEKDVPLGFGLAVNGIHRNYYHINLKVGVLKEDKKHDLFNIKTSESFELENYRVMAERLDSPQRTSI